MSSVTKQYMDLIEYNKNYHQNLLEVYMWKPARKWNSLQILVIQTWLLHLALGNELQISLSNRKGKLELILIIRHLYITLLGNKICLFLDAFSIFWRKRKCEGKEKAGKRVWGMLFSMVHLSVETKKLLLTKRMAMNTNYRSQ